jgi:hypothetical protein
VIYPDAPLRHAPSLSDVEEDGSHTFPLAVVSVGLINANEAVR